MIHRTQLEIAQFFGVEQDDVYAEIGFLRMKGSGKPVPIAMTLEIRGYADVVQDKRASPKRDAHGKGKGPTVFHGRKSKGGGART